MSETCRYISGLGRAKRRRQRPVATGSRGGRAVGAQIRESNGLPGRNYRRPPVRPIGTLSRGLGAACASRSS
jgi:hypothetical protein